MDELKAGISGETKLLVGPDDLATNYGNPGVEVLATPRVAALVEEAAIGVVAEYLQPGQVTVGARLELIHQAPTPPGKEVTIRALLAEMDGRKLTFEVVVSDDAGKVAEALHIRYIVSLDRFNQKVIERASGNPS